MKEAIGTNPRATQTILDRFPGSGRHSATSPETCLSPLHSPSQIELWAPEHQRLGFPVERIRFDLRALSRTPTSPQNFSGKVLGFLQLLSWQWGAIPLLLLVLLTISDWMWTPKHHRMGLPFWRKPHCGGTSGLTSGHPVLEKFLGSCRYQILVSHLRHECFDHLPVITTWELGHRTPTLDLGKPVIHRISPQVRIQDTISISSKLDQNVGLPGSSRELYLANSVKTAAAAH